MDDLEDAEIVYSAPERNSTEVVSFNGLNNGTEKSLIFHRVQTIFSSPDYQNSKIIVQIVGYDIASKEMKVIGDVENVSLSFGALSGDGSKLAMYAHNKTKRYVLIKDFQKDAVESINDIGIDHTILQLSWNSDGTTLVFSGRDQYEGPVYIFFLDVGSGKIQRWKQGMMPLLAPDSQKIAYSSPDGRSLIVSEIDGEEILHHRGYLIRDINQWIGDDMVLLTIAAGMYHDILAIVDLRNGKIHELNVPTTFEISGAAYKY